MILKSSIIQIPPRELISTVDDDDDEGDDDACINDKHQVDDLALKSIFYVLLINNYYS